MELDNESPVQTSRARWPSRLAFILASVGSTVGLGDVWRFPFLSYKHGGGAFLIPYILSLFVMALPLVQTELALGELHQPSPHLQAARLPRQSTPLRTSI
jgi:neurotransmitter:Na+ symporter, NSS family